MTGKINAAQIDIVLDSLKILVDTREQDTPAFRRRMSGVTVPWKRQKLDFGDYSAEFEIDGKLESMIDIAAIERKMSLDELAMCFCSERERFEREFTRANSAGCHIHLIVENATYENLFNGKYRSKFNPKSFAASLLSWSVRYGIKAHFCKAETTPKLIENIMRYELREYLLNGVIGFE